MAQPQHKPAEQSTQKPAAAASKPQSETITKADVGTIPASVLATVTAAEAAIDVNPNKITLAQVEAMQTPTEVIKAFGNKSNAIRGMASLGMKTGVIAKKLNIIYQHARNVLKKPLKREIAAQRAAQKEAAATAPAVTAPSAAAAKK